MPFEIGDVVQLKSGGPEMTVIELTDALFGTKPPTHVKTAWFDQDGKEKNAVFPFAAVEKVKG